MKRNYWIVLMMLLMLPVPMLAQTMTQRGVAYRYNGKKARTPLGNVTISYDANKRTVISGEQDGAFSLTLDGRRMGDRIGLVTVKKREMMVFNQHAVDEWSVRKEPLRLILCNADEFEQQKENLIAIGKREAKKKYDRQVADLEKQLADGKIKLQEKDAALDKAYEELERARKHMDEYADLFARIDESEVDTLAQQAIELFNQGEVERAIQKFEEGKFMEKVRQDNRVIKQARQMKSTAEKVEEEALDRRELHINSVKAQIESYKVWNEWEKAGQLLKELADEMNTVDDIFNYVQYEIQQRSYETAKEYCFKALKIYDSNPQDNEMHLVAKRVIYTTLGVIYQNTNDYEESKKYYSKAIDLSRKLIDTHPYEIAGYARTVGNFSNLLILEREFKRSRELLYQAKSIFEDLYKIDSISYRLEYVKCLFALSKTYTYQPAKHNQEEGMEYLVEAHKLLINTKNNAENEQMLGRVLLDMGYTYSVMREFEKAEKSFDDAKTIFSKLYSKDPDANVKELYNTLTMIGMYYHTQMRNLLKAKEYYEQAIKIMTPYVKYYPSVYTEIAVSLNELGAIYWELRDMNKSKELYEKALAICRNQIKETYSNQQSLSVSLINLGVIAMMNKESSKAEKYLEESVDIRRQLSDGKKDIDLANALLNLSVLYLNSYKDNFSICEDLLSEALENCSGLSQKEFDANKLSIHMNVLQYLGYICTTKKSYLKADSIYTNLVSLIENNKSFLLANNPNISNSLYGIYISASYSAVMVKSFNRAEQLAKEGLAVDSTQHFIHTNLAAALLFQGRYAEAEKIYLQYKSELKDSFLDDFRQFAEAGVIPKKCEADVERIKKMLNE